MNIPKKLKHIWIGPNPAPLKWMNTWPNKHQDWEYSVFDNNKLKNKTFINQHLIDEYMTRKNYPGVADLIRYELLYEEGGFIAPADSICLENTDELWIENPKICYTVYENEELRPGYVSPIYACNPGNTFLKLIIDTLNKVSVSKLSNKAYKVTGNAFLDTMIKTHNPFIKIFPSHYFLPSHYSTPEKRYNGPDKVYSEQFWGSTTNTYNNGL
jgi:mannosyltransferase OCH1-like enzyme